MFNILNVEPNLVKINRDLALFASRYVRNWHYFCRDDIVKESLNLVVDKYARGIEELYIRPISFPVVAQEVLHIHTKQYVTPNDEVER
jgi:hypothetical protein